MTSQRRILITGATGNVGSKMSERLASDYEIVRHGHSPEPGAVAADIADYDALAPLFEGIDTVIHLAAASRPESPWDDVLQANLIGTRNVLEAALQHGVRRVVFASSNHALGVYDRLGEWPVSTATPPRGDSLYGVSKIFGESLGRYYHDLHGLDFIALRIGWVSDDPSTTDNELMHAMWLSVDDCAQLLRCAIEAPVRFGIYYGISDNPNRRWDTTNTLVELGYRPRDSWTTAADSAERVVEGGAPPPPNWPENS